MQSTWFTEGMKRKMKKRKIKIAGRFALLFGHAMVLYDVWRYCMCSCKRYAATHVPFHFYSRLPHRRHWTNTLRAQPKLQQKEDFFYRDVYVSTLWSSKRGCARARASNSRTIDSREMSANILTHYVCTFLIWHCVQNGQHRVYLVCAIVGSPEIIKYFFFWISFQVSGAFALPPESLNRE